MRFTLGTRALAAALLLCVAGCSHLHWPWHRAAPPPPGPVHELEVSGAAADSIARSRMISPRRSFDPDVNADANIRDALTFCPFR